MSRLSIGVFSWNVAKLIEAVNGLEKEGHHVTGYEVAKLGGYGSFRHDRLVFLEYAPEVLAAWKAKGGVGDPEIVMPPAPRAFGDPVEALREPPPAVRRKPRKSEPGE